MKVALLDREGTVIVDPSYDRVDCIEKVRLLPYALEALGHLAAHNFAIIFITNQSSIGQGHITEDGFSQIHAAVLKMIKPSGINVLGTYVCPHGPSDNCACRKPQPTMLLEAADDYGFSLADTYMVGDRLSDISAGINAGAKTILVETGKRPVSSDEVSFTAPNLLDAVRHIVQQTPSN
jgi:D-glycero-D-manno-heptose 1,7-bisphosphate phosphatase